MNKYQEALDELEFASVQYYSYVDIDAVKIMLEHSQLLQELIDMHNKPLKLEEIKEGMLVWDSKNGSYGVVYDVSDDELCINGYLFTDCRYEDNRFYCYKPLKEEQL